MPSDVVGILESEDWAGGEHNSQCRSAWKSALKWCLPSLLAEKAAPPRQTAYLDGMRGFAALLVYWHHHQHWAHPGPLVAIMESGFGLNNEYRFATFPGIRAFFNGGHYAVSVLFVISGYVLSIKPLTLVHAREQAKLADHLSSALFRRWARLYTPLICTTFLFMTSWHVLGLWTSGAKPQPSYRGELWAWYAELKNFSFVFNCGGVPWLSYNFHLWSIPMEFKGSVVIFTSVLAFSRCSRNARLLLEAGLVFYFLYIVDGWYCAFFSAGMLLCDLELLAARDALPSIFTQLQPAKKLIFHQLLVVSLYMGGVPSHSTDVADLGKNPGWYYLSFLKPQAALNYAWFYLFWAAVLFVASVPHIWWLKRFFEMDFCQYLGRVCFALYLVHGPILLTLGDRLYTAFGWHTEAQVRNLSEWVDIVELPKWGPLGLELSFLVPHLILLPVTLYCADLVTRAFDKPSMKIPQRLYATTLGHPTRPRQPGDAVGLSNLFTTNAHQ
ncbi:acyltransferase family-domain-containing protein [Lasiosphaeria ovina]|uniref:Acyltransferase family-domain-containing protein n=1 Tax=Lasiosphaeria ovina TaxID=92902 RepID=A0AAE0K4K8_9PEZI|nr:acyltransferase family-domain-containing protein [Lasiosphaeria ovina]